MELRAISILKGCRSRELNVDAGARFLAACRIQKAIGTAVTKNKPAAPMKLRATNQEIVAFTAKNSIQDIQGLIFATQRP